MADKHIRLIDWLVFLVRIAAAGAALSILCYAEPTALFLEQTTAKPEPARMMRGGEQIELKLGRIESFMEQYVRDHERHDASIAGLEKTVYQDHNKQITVLETEVTSVLTWIKILAVAIVGQLIAGLWEHIKKVGGRR